ncbi:MAG: C69 family dipeptidase [Clostridiales bacterium]|nr:C69 family dipeptidase [Clostridiales bacterium]
MWKIFVKAAALTAALCLFIQSAASACTAFYVGREASADGSVMLARTEDTVSANNKLFVVHEAADHESGEMYKDAFGFTLEYPKHTYRYTAVCDSDKRGIGKAPYGEAGFNEMGLAATSTVTAYPNDAALKADPLVKTGLHEISANDIILSRTKTAREAIELVASVIDEKGSGEGNIIMVADRDEAWYMEILSGHQYAAVKMPEDKIAVIPNNYMLGTIDVNSEDVIVSPNLVELARENDFLVEEDGMINVQKTYSAGFKSAGTYRLWGGQTFLSPTRQVTPQDEDYELFFEPDHKISLEEIMEVQRYRYESTKYDTNLEENKDIRAIGIARQAECHVLQIRPDMPKEAAGIEWLCMGNSEFSVFLPFYASLMTETAQVFKENDIVFNNNSAFWNFRGLSTLCALNRERYGSQVRAFWKSYEENMIAKIPFMDEQAKTLIAEDMSAARLAANTNAAVIGNDATAKARTIYNELMTFIADEEGNVESGEDVSMNIYTPKEVSNVALPEYLDVYSDAWYAKNVDFVVKKGYMKGTGSYIFSPDTKLTRAQFLAIMYRMFYSGIADEHWIEQSMSVVDELGLGWSEEDIYQNITREEFAKVCAGLTENVTLKSVNKDIIFSDEAQISADCQKAVMTLCGAGIINGYDDGTFKPKNNLTRAEASQIIYNLASKLNK